MAMTGSNLLGESRKNQAHAEPRCSIPSTETESQFYTRNKRFISVFDFFSGMARQSPRPAGLSARGVINLRPKRPLIRPALRRLRRPGSGRRLNRSDIIMPEDPE
ncbi:uncharacterized protein VTP21DRAFT_10909 [Calcarisporiella thermophila]|uniref:uncharacterized protein n=1 Tax=Calcarisporiella thermophila TaxID=911321 RepID=UPI0037439200